MALGGGTWTTQNKVLAGAYITFVSKAAINSTISDRGVVAMANTLAWGKEGEIITVTASDLMKNSLELFGYDYSADEMKPFRDLFKNAIKLYTYRLNGGGTKASNKHCTAKYGGTRGNSLSTVISANIDNPDEFDVKTLFAGNVVDVQTVASASDLKENSYVTWKEETLANSAGIPLTGGTDTPVTTTQHQAFLAKLENYPDVNAVGYFADDNAIKILYAGWVKNLRENIGIKLQAVLFNYKGDYEGVVNVKNTVDLIPWVTGVIGGYPINKSATNIICDSEYDVQTDYTQLELEKAIKAGEFVVHRVGEENRVLMDINSLVSLTDDHGSVFQDNQCIRTIDTIATAVAGIFNTKYLGRVPNDKDGRVSLWGDIKNIFKNCEDVRAIQDFDDGKLTVEQGKEKGAVLVYSEITVTAAMTKLYMKTIVG